MKDSDKLHKHIADEEQAEMDYLHKQAEKKENWFFTWGVGQGNRMFYARIIGTRESSRERMVALFGTMWASQYSEKEFEGTAERWGYTLHPISLTDEAQA